MAQEFDAYHKWLGIPPDEQPPNHYRLLALADYEADLDVIEAAANQRMSYVRECATGPHSALSQQILNHISTARIELLQPNTKAKYDAKLKEAEKSDNLEQQDAAALGTVTDFTIPTTRKRTARKPRPKPQGLTWHLPVYVAAAMLLLAIGVFWAAPMVRAKLLGIEIEVAAVASFESPTADLQIREQAVAAEEEDELAKKFAEVVKKEDAAVVAENPAAGEGDLPVIILDDRTAPEDREIAPGTGKPDKGPGGSLPSIESPAATDKEDAPKLPLPNTEQRKVALQQIKDKFGRIKKADEKFHARFLISQLDNYEGRPHTQYMLLERSLEFAKKNLDFLVAMNAVELIEGTYDIDGDALRTSTMVEFVRLIDPKASNYQIFLLQAMSLLDEHLLNDRLELAIDLFDAFNDTEEKKAALKRELKKRLVAIERAREYAKDLSRWLATIEEPDLDVAEDARKAERQQLEKKKARQQLGLYYYFVRGRKAQGLAEMAKCDNEALAKVAAMDNAASSASRTSDEMIELGEAWRAAAGKMRGKTQKYKQALNERGRYWLVRAYTDALQGYMRMDEELDRSPAQKILADVEAVLKKEQLLLVNSIGMRLIYVPPGEFTMGSPESEPHRHGFKIKNEILEKNIPLSEEQHRVRLTKGFFMGIFEVTQEQFEAISTFNPSPSPANPKAPVSNITQVEAKDFLKALSVKDGRAYRLPTEAEWEYACRAGTDSAFNVGHRLEPSHARFGRDNTYAVPVGSFAPNDFGLFDMHGNVSEWVNDYYMDGYFDRPDSRVDPKGPGVTGSRLYRGGGFDNAAGFCRSAARAIKSGRRKKESLGFRVVFGAR